MRIAGYNCISEISRGPLTTVYLCQGKTHSDLRLIKILHPQHRNDQEILKRFLREATLYAKLDHPNIVKVLDLGESNNLHYIVLEYIVGWSMDKFLLNTGPIPAHISISFVCQMFDGLKYAHEKRVIHRDIKPSNILVAQTGQVKIADFGLARQSDFSAITEQGNILGTPAYMAPEVLRGEEASIRSEIFSLGITWYEMLTHKNPFRGESIPESINHILNTDPIPITGINSNIPPWIDRLVHRMLSKNPDLRPNNCNDVLKEIDVHEPHGGDANYAQTIKQYINENKILPIDHFPASASKSTRKKPFTIARYAIFLIILTLGVIYFVFDEPKSEDITINESDINLKDSVISEISIPTISDKSYELSSEQGLKVVTKPDISDSVDIAEEQSANAVLIPGSLYVAVTPWAEVFVNGQYLGTTPLFRDIELSPGRHKVELRNPSFREYQTHLDIKPGVVDTLKVLLENLYGDLMVSVNPWGEIYLNDKFIDTTPLKQPIRLQCGRYNLEVRNPYFETHSERIEIESGVTREITINLVN